LFRNGRGDDREGVEREETAVEELAQQASEGESKAVAEVVGEKPTAPAGEENTTDGDGLEAALSEDTSY
jgi:hypothetical protein